MLDSIMTLPMPRNLVDTARQEGRDQWLATLPATVERLERDWSLRIGPPFQPGGQAAWVAPAHRARLGNVVVKVAWRHMEAADEAEGLREWDGDGAVRLHAAKEVDEQTMAMLLERCRPGTMLAERPGLEQDAVVAGLLRRLWRSPTTANRFRPLQDLCDAWADGFEAKVRRRRRRVDPGLTRAGITLFRSLPATSVREVLLFTDLHAGNVLAAQREPWLAIDPKPFVGDPTYDALQHILNCEERLATDPNGLASRMAGLLDLDADRLRLWLFARCVQESADYPPLAEVARRIAPA